MSRLASVGSYDGVHCAAVSSQSRRRMVCERGEELTGKGLWDLLVHNHIDAHTALGGGSEHAVQTILLIAGRRASQVQLWAVCVCTFCVNQAVQRNTMI